MFNIELCRAQILTEWDFTMSLSTKERKKERIKYKYYFKYKIFMKKVFLKCLKRVLFFVTKIVLKYFSIIDKAEKKNWILDGKKKQIRTVALEANSKTENSFFFNIICI